MANRIKILQLAPQFPFPMDDGGKISIGSLTKFFSKYGAEVTLFCFSEKEIPDKYINEAELYCKLEIYHHSTKNTIPRIAKSFFFNHSIYVSKHINNKIKQKIKELVIANSFDIIHTDHTCMASLALFIKSFTNIPVGLRLHNIEWIIWERYAESIRKNIVKRNYIHKQAKLLKGKEKEFIQQAEVSFTISETDFYRAKELSPSSNIICAPAGVDLDFWKPMNEVERNSEELIIATTYKWIHNVNALKWFLDEVFPKVIEKIPKVKLTLLGKEPPQWLSHYFPQNIQIVGYVEDIRSYLSKANIYIAPLFVGSGIRIKIIEAMAMELPVVATKVSAEGINASQSEGLFISDAANQYAEIIINLIKDYSYTRELGKSSRRYISENFSWSKTTEIILNEYFKLVSNKK